MEDQSGLEPQDGDWMDLSTPSPTLFGLMTEIGRAFTPVMLANAKAVATKAERVEATVDGQRWTQAPFPYQAKTLGWLRTSYERLPAEGRRTVDGLLAGTGCEPLFAMVG